jgi:hypothetical protein
MTHVVENVNSTRSKLLQSLSGVLLLVIERLLNAKFVLKELNLFIVSCACDNV